MPRANSFLYTAILVLAGMHIACMFPGIGNADTDLQYAQAMSGQYSDWHPPVMAFLWGHLPFASHGYAPLFLLHIACYWLGFGLLADALLRQGRHYAAWLILLVAIAPPFLAFASTLHKDTGMAVSLLCAFAIMFRFRSAGGRKHLYTIFASLFLLYGILVRSNAIFAGAPLLLYILYPTVFARPVRFIAAYIAIVIVTIPLSSIINHKLLGAEETHPIRSLQLFDVTGIAFYAHDASVFWPGPYTNALVEQCYTPVLWDTLAHGDACHVFWDSASPGQSKVWLNAIAHHPLAYAQHRLTHLNSELSFIVPRHMAGAYKTSLTTGAAIAPPGLKGWDMWLDKANSLALFAPVFALVVGMFLLARYFRNGDAAVQCLLVSAIAYMLGFGVVGVASEYRYQFWPMVAVFIAGVLASRRVTWRQVAAAAAVYGAIAAAHYTQGDTWTGGHVPREWK